MLERDHDAELLARIDAILANVKFSKFEGLPPARVVARLVIQLLTPSGTTASIPYAHPGVAPAR